jgi:microcystin-dependent protein
MATITGHTTRAAGTILSAAIYNADHVNHVSNASNLNADKLEGATSPVVDGHVVLWEGTSAAALKSAGHGPVPPSRQIATAAGLTGGGDLTANRTLAPDFATQAEAEAGTVDNKVMSPLRTAQALATVSGVPVGVVIPFAGSAAPTDWLLCAGQAVSRTTFSALWDVIGTTYGAGDGSTTFNLPDLRGRVAAGKDNMGGTAANRLTNSGTGNPGINGALLGGAGGVDRHTLTTAQMPSHLHTYSRAQSDEGGTGSGSNFGLENVTTNTNSAGGDEAHPNAQPTLVLNYIIFANASA